MKNSENNKSLLRRYLDDLYTMDDARKLMGRNFPAITADRP